MNAWKCVCGGGSGSDGGGDGSDGSGWADDGT